MFSGSERKPKHPEETHEDINPRTLTQSQDQIWDTGTVRQQQYCHSATHRMYERNAKTRKSLDVLLSGLGAQAQNSGGHISLSPLSCSTSK